MKLNRIYDNEVLHRMGAMSVTADPLANTTTVTPDIDITNYDSVKQQIDQEKATIEADKIQKVNDINSNLPAWKQVSDEIDGISSLAGAKVALKKIARIVYWLAKNQME